MVVVRFAISPMLEIIDRANSFDRESNMGVDSGRASENGPFLDVANAILGVVVDESGIQRQVEAGSRLASEIECSVTDMEQHFAAELANHCAMLAIAIADSCSALDRLEPELPFSAVVLVRGLMESAADLHWLSDPNVDGRERTRRAFQTYLRQHETQIRQLEQFAKRFPDVAKREHFENGIAEGWESLEVHAKEMAKAGHDLRTSSKPGERYRIGTPKPSRSDLVDAVIIEFHGKTSLNLYSKYSTSAHVEGVGLEALQDLTDTVETPEGVRNRYGFDEQTWSGLVVTPGLRVACGSVAEWTDFAYPSLHRDFMTKIQQASQQ
ncbi:MAG: hypothetical protein ACYC1I_10555 [Acidimicrobiales bacterium]